MSHFTNESLEVKNIGFDKESGLLTFKMDDGNWQMVRISKWQQRRLLGLLDCLEELEGTEELEYVAHD